MKHTIIAIVCTILDYLELTYKIMTNGIKPFSIQTKSMVMLRIFPFYTSWTFYKGFYSIINVTLLGTSKSKNVYKLKKQVITAPMITRFKKNTT